MPVQLPVSQPPANVHHHNAKIMTPMLIVAPMVNQSDAPFRSLCYRHGATCCYTEMLYSDRIVNDAGYLSAYLPQCDMTYLAVEDATESGSGIVRGRDSKLETDTYTEVSQAKKPQQQPQLVVQVCGNDPETLAAAVTLIADRQCCDAIDLNLGCPQDRAKQGLFGSYLLDRTHWPLVFECVAAMSTALRTHPHGVPLYCKIRLIDDTKGVLEATKEFCRGLCERGVRLICIHGRTRGSAKRRRCGPADLAAIRDIASYLHAIFSPPYPSVRIVANGNIYDTRDVAQNLQSCCSSSGEQECANRAVSQVCCGVMSAEGVLRNPAIFASMRIAAAVESSPLACESITMPYLTSLLTPQPRPPTSPLNSPKNEMTMTQPDLYSLFSEYCELSERYREAGGWQGMDSYELERLKEPKQVSVARQHLSWMLGKSGHGRLVRYKYGVPGGSVTGSSCSSDGNVSISGDGVFFYRKHVHLMRDLNAAESMSDLLSVAQRCLTNQYAGVRECDHPGERPS